MVMVKKAAQYECNIMGTKNRSIFDVTFHMFESRNEVLLDRWGEALQD
jgi:hypothetical protein